MWSFLEEERERRERVTERKRVRERESVRERERERERHMVGCVGWMEYSGTWWRLR